MSKICSFCGDGWRVETVNLSGPAAGQVTGVLHPIAAEWEEGYSRPSTGSLTLAARDPSADDVWPDTGVFISQVMSDGSRRGRFGGYIDKTVGASGGALTVALLSIDSFLDERLLAGPDSPYAITSIITDPIFEQKIQYIVRKPVSMEVVSDFYTSSKYPITKGSLPVFLVRVAQGNLEGEGITGVPILNAVLDEPYTVETGPVYPAFTEPVQNWWDFKNIGQYIRETTEAETGVKYWLEHTYTNGYWSTLMHFSDQIGRDHDYTLKSDREGWVYALEVDGSDRASRVYGLGAGEEWNTQFSIAYDAGRDENYPERQATVAWKDQTVTDTIDGLTRGWVADHRDPTTVPSMTVVGMPDYDPDAAGFDPQKGFPPPEDCRPGDTFNVDIGYGAVTVTDIRVRNLGVAWSLKEGAPVERVIAMQPVERAALSVRTQTPARPPAPTQPVVEGPVTVDPWPKPGKLVNVTNTGLNEISGMEASIKNPNHVWVHNDEQASTHQVHLVSLKDGHTAATYTPNPGVSAAPVGDPEAIRISRVSGKLVLADIGDNDLNRPTSGANQPHLLSVVEPKGAGSKGNITATRLPIAYPNGERVNAETLLIHPTSDEVFIVSKEASRSRVFSYGTLSSMSTANNVGTLVAEFPAIKNVSDGTHTWAGGFVLLLSAGSQKVVVLKNNWRYAGTINIPALAKAEAIAVRDTCSFVVTGEGVQAPIYQVLIPKSFGATCSSPSGPATPPSPSNPSATVPGQLIDMSGWKLQLPI